MAKWWKKFYKHAEVMHIKIYIKKTRTTRKPDPSLLLLLFSFLFRFIFDVVVCLFLYSCVLCVCVCELIHILYTYFQCWILCCSVRLHTDKWSYPFSRKTGQIGYLLHFFYGFYSMCFSFLFIFLP